MTTGQRIRDLRKQQGLSAEDLAAKLGLSAATIYRYENGDIEKVRGDILEPLAKILHTTPAYLMGWEENAQASSDLPANLEPYRPKGQMPILGRVAAGLPMFAEENIIGYCANDFNDGEDYYALIVHGDSMTAAGIDDGDLVVVRRQSCVDEGQIAVVLVNGDDATVKYIRCQDNMVVLIPRSYNPVHQPQFYNIQDTPVSVIGRVVQIRKSV